MTERKKRQEQPAAAGKNARGQPLDIDRLLRGAPEARATYETHGDVLEACELIREMRTTRGLTQEQLADLAGTTQSHLSELERGRGRQGPTVELLSRIARACGEPVAIVRRAELDALRRSAESARSDFLNTQFQLYATRAELDAARRELEEAKEKAKEQPKLYRHAKRRYGGSYPMAPVELKIIEDVASRLQMSPAKVTEGIGVFLEGVDAALVDHPSLQISGLGKFTVTAGQTGKRGIKRNLWGKRPFQIRRPAAKSTD